jgi:AraC-like DNA-binding protein
LKAVAKLAEHGRGCFRISASRRRFLVTFALTARALSRHALAVSGPVDIAAPVGPLQRMAVLVGIPALLREFGVPLASLLDVVPVTPGIFDDPETRIPYAIAVRLLETAARLSRCPHFGLLLGARFDHRILGPAGEWMQNAPDLEAAVTGLVALQPAASRGATVFLHRLGEDIVLGYGAFDRSAGPSDQASLAMTAIAHTVVTRLTAGKARPTEVWLAVRRPVDTAPYASHFGVPVRFDQPVTGLLLGRRALAEPIRGARAVDFEKLQRRASAMMPPTQEVWTDRLRRILRPMLLHGQVSAEAAAARLAISPRTLSRHLAREGTSFQAVLDETRFATARELLALTDLPVGDVAQALSYATHGAFVGAFRRWSGQSPSAWRGQARV